MSIHLGILGTGSMSRHHVCSARATAGVGLVALADPGGDRLGVADDLSALGGVEEIIEIGIDAAIIAAPTAYHEAVALVPTEVGVYTLVEKPLAASVETGRRIRDASAAAGLVGAVGYIERCDPALIDVHRWIAEGQPGAIEQIVTCRRSPFLARTSDVSMVKGLTTHDVDLAAWMAGAPYESIHVRTSAHPGRVHEDMMATLGIFADDILANHLVNWLTSFRDRTTIVTGERGALVVDAAMGDSTFYEDGHALLQWNAIAAFRGVSEGQVARYALIKRESLALEHERFRDATLGAGNGHVTMDKALDNPRVVEITLSSAATGRSVDL